MPNPPEPSRCQSALAMAAAFGAIYLLIALLLAVGTAGLAVLPAFMQSAAATITRPFMFLMTLAWFSAPGLWVLLAQGHRPASPGILMVIAIGLHYPVLGFISGYLFPCSLAFNRQCARRVALRFGLCVLCMLLLGLLIGLYLVAHDS